jgi:hypothetical protein
MHSARTSLAPALFERYIYFPLCLITLAGSLFRCVLSARSYSLVANFFSEVVSPLNLWRLPIFCAFSRARACFATRRLDVPHLCATAWENLDLHSRCVPSGSKGNLRLRKWNNCFCSRPRVASAAVDLLSFNFLVAKSSYGSSQSYHAVASKGIWCLVCNSKTMALFIFQLYYFNQLLCRKISLKKRRKLLKQDLIKLFNFKANNERVWQNSKINIFI